MSYFAKPFSCPLKFLKCEEKEDLLFNSERVVEVKEGLRYSRSLSTCTLAHTYIHIHTHKHMYIYMCVCVMQKWVIP